jgi:hypothetical protein
MLATPQRRGSLLPLLARLRLQGVGPTSDLWQGRLDIPLVEDARQVRGVRPDQHGWQAGAQARQRPLQWISLSRRVQRHILVILSPGIVVMRLPLKTVKAEDLVLLVIRPTKHMDTDALIVLKTAVLDTKPEQTGRNVNSLCGVSIVAWGVIAPFPTQTGQLRYWHLKSNNC